MLPVIIVLIVIILFFIFLFFLYYRTFHYSPRRQKKPGYTLKMEDIHKAKLKQIRDDLKSADAERIYIRNRENMRLSAKYYHHNDNAPIAIIFHGYRGSSLKDPAGGYEILRNMGLNVLIPDQRAHGESDGRTITFGIKERFDCLDWINYLNERFDPCSILLMGVSMGAATVLMTSGEDLPPNVRGVIADCGYSSPEAIIRKVISVDMKLPHKLLYPFVRLSSIVFGRFDVSSYNALSAVSNKKIPILIIHGESDDFVPCEMAYEIKEAGDCQLFTVPNATHGMSYIYDTEKYMDTAVSFIKALI